MRPEQAIKCLLVQTRFSEYSFWNYRISCETQGAKTPTAPLGLLTLAAILPQHWTFRLLDLNCRDFCEEDWQWAEMICVGGMLPQQSAMLEIIRRGKKNGKFVVVGGVDPTSQPKTYAEADALVLGEAEATVPLWLQQWKNGNPRGTFVAEEKPDITKSPVPRFDLIKIADYQHLGIQYSRGCPFNCEFCDVIELFGRKSRTKTPGQVIKELETLFQLGHRGQVDLVDDNFIGNKRLVKDELLPALIEWNNRKKWPFYYSTEASLNISDDAQLLRQMRAADFRFIFLGIETPDPAVLKSTQKGLNAMRPIVDRVNILYDYGMVAGAGFIMGFDGEKVGMDEMLIRCIEDTGICVAMVGLLVALPNTQLTKRLQREGRLFDMQFRSTEGAYADENGMVKDCIFEVVDQTVAGLNFVTSRNRLEILNEFENVIVSVYEPKAYMDRIMRTVRKLKLRHKYLPKGMMVLRQLRALMRVCILMSKRPVTRRYFWRNFLRLIFMGPFKFETAMTYMAPYLHYQKQAAFLQRSLRAQKEFASH